MARLRRPKALGLQINVILTDSIELARGHAHPFEDSTDDDGHHISYEMGPMRGDALCWLTLRRGLSTDTAADLLRKLADRLERHGHRLLSMPLGGEGWF